MVWFADAIVVVHLAYLVFIPVGGVLALRWSRLVGPHLVAVAIGVASITVGFDCPLTTWEQWLRRKGGQQAYTNGFVDHYLTGRIFPRGYAWAVQALFAACFVASYAVIIGRRSSSRPAPRRG